MSVYLTQFPINMTRRESKSMLASPYRMHAAIAGSFPTVASSPEGRVLWRVDSSQGGPSYLYIASPERPSLVGLNEQIGWPDLKDQWRTADYERFLDSIEVGRRYQFRLVANPVVSRRSAVGSNGHSKRIPHLTALQQAAWLVGEEAFVAHGVEVPQAFPRQEESRAERNGFSVLRDDRTGVLRMVVSDMRTVKFRKGSSGKIITLSTARYDGLLEVTDRDLLRHALTHGIGHAKGFGCGLITLVPVNPS